MWAVVLLTACSPSNGFEVWKAPNDGPLAAFPEGGFYDPEAACEEYAALLNRQDAKRNPVLDSLWREASNRTGGYHCKPR